MSKTEQYNHKIKQDFFVEASKMMQSLYESELLPNPKFTNEIPTPINKVKKSILGNPEKQLSTAKNNALAELTNFMAMFPDFTYQRNKKGLTTPSFTHSIVKFKEALNTFIMQQGDTQIYMLSQKLIKRLDQLLNLNPVDKLNRVREIDPLERVKENNDPEYIKTLKDSGFEVNTPKEPIDYEK